MTQCSTQLAFSFHEKSRLVADFLGGKIIHDVLTLFRQRLLTLVAGYQDGNDHNRLEATRHPSSSVTAASSQRRTGPVSPPSPALKMPSLPGRSSNSIASSFNNTFSSTGKNLPSKSSWTCIPPMPLLWTEAAVTVPRLLRPVHVSASVSL